MTPSPSAQLYLGLCLCWGIWAEEGPLPRPSLRVEPGLMIPWGKPVTLWCEGPPGADQYHLWKEEGLQNRVIFADSREAQVIISNMKAKTAGRYLCQYKSQALWSDVSDPLELIVTRLHDPPSLSALPSSQVASGQEVTLQCQSQLRYDRSALHKDGEGITYGVAQDNGQGSQTNFSISAVNPAHGGTYRCYSFHSDNPYVWSASSDPLVLRVPDSAPPDYTVGNVVHLLLAGLVLIILSILIIDVCKASGGAKKSTRRPQTEQPRHAQPEEGMTE